MNATTVRYALLGMAVAAGIVVALELPEIRRYLSMRRM